MRWSTRGISLYQAKHMALLTLACTIAGGWRGFLLGAGFCAFGWMLSCID